LTYRAQGYRSCCEANEAAITGIWLVDGISVVVAELVDYLCDSIMVALSEAFADKFL
jgi:hypothetical protein